ncbi:hypothetical protein LENED_005517 [Lentinula edodes]|uniref:Uncharacterized protein n=1 Tax=Lentinula edodes TaxID=5353 RepID=A0A1Q3E968_LENED|nr:hypothetical protein LENED_005517 [Lentinula edodes]
MISYDRSFSSCSQWESMRLSCLYSKSSSLEQAALFVSRCLFATSRKLSHFSFQRVFGISTTVRRFRARSGHTQHPIFVREGKYFGHF